MTTGEPPAAPASRGKQFISSLLAIPAHERSRALMAMRSSLHYPDRMAPAAAAYVLPALPLGIHQEGTGPYYTAAALYALWETGSRGRRGGYPASVGGALRTLKAKGEDIAAEAMARDLLRLRANQAHRVLQRAVTHFAHAGISLNWARLTDDLINPDWGKVQRSWAYDYYYVSRTDRTTAQPSTASVDSEKE
ncbi:type I-E CRISPR-associated protein Cse2/CasB [uncultured Kocuria sp.]|uniref:type I-E CRISPR-associated protein Cse2/CasB n=1 Tax=uncultured Kocuria sp. TaxID=259305 RepID=UPI00261A4CA3|nr:type I-E CRISPR-associated protein Cse2/CasB [uncultured Kocuria sp.]